MPSSTKSWAIPGSWTASGAPTASADCHVMCQAHDRDCAQHTSQLVVYGSQRYHNGGRRWVLQDPADVTRVTLTDGIRVDRDPVTAGVLMGRPVSVSVKFWAMSRLSGRPTLRTESNNPTTIGVEFAAAPGTVMEDVGPAAGWDGEDSAADDV